MIKKIFIAIAFISLVTAGCSKDDICSPDTPTTPLLIITFNDINNPGVRKTVQGLTVRATSVDGIVVNAATTDSIAIPLPTGADSTEYEFRMNSNTEPVSDFYIFDYTREDVYVNRACSFKTTYTDLTLTDDGIANWIFRETINNSTIEDETQAHLTFFH